MITSSSNVTFLSNDSVFYDLRQTGCTGVFIRLTSNEFTENSTPPEFISSISNQILLHNGEAKIFIPACELQ